MPFFEILHVKTLLFDSPPNMENLSFSKILSIFVKTLGFNFKYTLPLSFKIQGVLGVLSHCFMIWGPPPLQYFVSALRFTGFDCKRKVLKNDKLQSFVHTMYVKLFFIDQKQHTNRTMINLNDPHCALLSKGICHFESYEMSENF